MKKLLALLLSCGLLAGCGAKKETATTVTPTATSAPVTLSVLSPTGAPGYALLPFATNDEVNLTLSDGADAIQAAFVNPSSDYDMIVAPTNLGVKLIDAKKADYSLAAVITTGNLYLVGENEEALSSGSIGLFGENAVPGLVYKHVQPIENTNEQWFNAVQDVQAALLSGQVQVGLLAEPAATATIAKAKSNGKTLQKLVNIQEKWGEDGYPMASLFVKNETLKEHEGEVKELIESLMDYSEDVKNGTADVASDLDALLNASDFGAVPSAIIKQTYEAMGIRPSFAYDQKEDIQKFLDLFQVVLQDESVVNFK